MKDIIIEAGRKLGKYLREELDGRVTQLNTKRLNAAATDLLPGERYAHVRLFMERCERYHLLTKYAESDLERDAKVGDIVHALKEKELMTEESGRFCAALVIVISEGTPDAENYAKSLFEVQTPTAPVTPTPVPQNTQPKQPAPTVPSTPKNSTPEAVKVAPIVTAQPQKTIQPKPTNLDSFEIRGQTLVKYKGNSGDVIIPNSVTTIGKEAFAKCELLKSVVIPGSVKKIEWNAFYGCENLERVALSEGIYTISCGAFSWCYSLASIHIPASVTEIDSEAFKYCKNLSSMTVEVGNKRYHSSGNCIIETEKRTLVCGCNHSVIPTDGSVTIIGRLAFCSCEKLESINIPNCVTRIEDNAFSNCQSLKSIIISDNVEYIGDSAFSLCKGLVSINIPKYLNKIGRYAFMHCYSLESITIPKGVVSIMMSAFCVCKGLKNVDIPESVTEIGESAFSDCTSLESVRIMGKKVNIEENAFKECPKLTIYKADGINLFAKIFGTKWNPNRRPVIKL